VTELGWEQVLAFRLARHGLDRRRRLTGASLARQINGVHAQVMSAAEASIGARSSSARPQSIQRELWGSRRLVKTWAMRTTLHLLAASDVPLLMAALRGGTPARQAAWDKYFGVPPGGREELVAAVAAELDGRVLTRRELAEGVVRRLSWMPLEKMLSGWGTFLGLPARAGVLCFGPSLGTSVRFVRPDQWLGSWVPVDEVEARRELLRRYLRVNGPAVRRDFQLWWGRSSGAPVWGSLLPEMVEVSVEGSRGWMLAADLAEARAARFVEEVRLLPYFDHYLLTHHASRDHLVGPEHRAKIYRTAGWVTPTLLIRGRVEGTWSLERDAVSVTPFRRLTASERRGLLREVELLGAFLGAPLRLA
jgi:Winged helix DNA-binding domain